MNPGKQKPIAIQNCHIRPHVSPGGNTRIVLKHHLFRDSLKLILVIENKVTSWEKKSGLVK